MSDYIKFANCRICQLDADHKVKSDLDFKILEGTPIDQVVGEFSQYFTDPQKPLNYWAVQRHKSHLSKQVASNLIGIPSIPPSGEFDKNSIVVSDGKDTGLGSFIDFVLKNKETLDELKESAKEDLINSDVYLGQASTPKAQALILSVRNNIRDSIADITAMEQKLLTPQLGNASSKNNAQVVELVMIAKRSAILAIRDKTVRESFLKELALQISSSPELKWLNTEE
jgi:hypothetical protein